MTRHIRYIHIIILLLAGMGWVSCKQERPICFEPTTAVLRVGTYQAIEGDTGVIVSDSILPNAYIYSLDTAKIQINADAPGNKFGLLLSPHVDSTRFVVLADSAQILRPQLYDTVTFYYKRRLTFLSVACGYTYFYTLESGVKTTNNYIDSIIVTNTDVTNAASIEHVKIYF